MAGPFTAFALLASLPAVEPEPQAAPEPPRAEAPTAKFSTKTPLTTLMANAQAREVLRKYLPKIVEILENGGASQAPAGFNLESLAAVSRAGVTPEILKSINEDLARL